MTRPFEQRRECTIVAPMLTAREGELSAEEVSLLDQHLQGCDECRAISLALAETDGLVGEALLAEAARRDFAPFVDEVMARVGAGPQEKASLWARALAWARAHRAAALMGTLAPTLAGLALIVYFSDSETPPPPLAGEVEVVAEGRAPMVLQTSEGPVVLLGGTDGT
jgi:predicted anti-sigma-YlaC factor YlaD